jgi:hypothetical protein
MHISATLVMVVVVVVVEVSASRCAQCDQVRLGDCQELQRHL